MTHTCCEIASSKIYNHEKNIIAAVRIILTILLFEPQRLLTFAVFAPVVRIFFINPRPVCCDTEKGGEGAKDTGTTTRKGVTKRVARGYLHSYSCTGGEVPVRDPSPPPPHNPAFWTVFQLPCYI
jgi:hypothetical protein